MAEDMFGDSSLFDEFEKERESKGSFILFKVNEEGEEDKSKILFSKGDSEESESSSDSDSGESENENNDDAEEKKHEGTSVHEHVHSGDIVNGGNDRTKNRQPVDKNTEYKLTHERNKFERYARIIDSTRFACDSNSPACQIIYQNNNFSRKYRTAIEHYITHLISREEQNRNPEKLPELELKSSNLTCVDLNSKLTADQRNMKMWSAHAILGSSQFHTDYVIDPLGWPLVSNNPALTDSWEAPKYEQVYTDPLPLPEEEVDSGPGKEQRQKPTCFNCCGEHMIADCPDPKDFTRIRQNRDKFRQESGSQKPPAKRYHLDKSFQSEGNTFVPGVVSEELMEALGITSRYLPSYIYKMRVLGYPPGWLEEAKVRSSGLVMFDGEGNEIDVTGESLEDGEVSDTVPNKGQINPEKIIAYPGFTVAVPPDTIDEFEELGAPPLQDHQLKSTLTAQLSGMKRKNEDVEEEARKKKRKVERASMEEMDLSDGEDLKNRSMDSDGFVPPLPMDTPPSKPPIPDSTPPVTPDTVKPKRLALAGEPPLPLNTPPGKPPIPTETPPPTPEGSTPAKHRQVSEVSEVGGALVRNRSPSLEDLEQQYQLLQEKLCEADGDKEVELQVMDSCGPDDDGLDLKSQLSKVSSVESASTSGTPDVSQRQMSRMSSTASITSFGDLGRGSPTSSLPGTPVVGPASDLTELNFSFKSVTGSISRDYGTPIQKRQGVASDLPDADKFGEGIMDHIPYENLPEATGTFEKMRGLIGRIRSKVSLRKKKKS